MLFSQDFVRNCKIKRVHPSIRDFVRGMKLYLFFKSEQGRKIVRPMKEAAQVHWQSLLLSLAVTYYFRLPSEHLAKFTAEIDKKISAMKSPFRKFSTFVDEELSYFYDLMDIPAGIAKTKSLQMNLFCNVVCIQTKIPLLITGDPGRSKTLSFNIACDNMKGLRSKKEDFKQLSNVTRFHYQCSESSTASEIESVYENAVRNQKSFEEFGKRNEQCVVFLDEGGFFLLCFFFFFFFFQLSNILSQLQYPSFLDLK